MTQRVIALGTKNEFLKHLNRRQVVVEGKPLKIVSRQIILEDGTVLEFKVSELAKSFER